MGETAGGGDAGAGEFCPWMTGRSAAMHSRIPQKTAIIFFVILHCILYLVAAGAGLVVAPGAFGEGCCLKAVVLVAGAAAGAALLLGLPLLVESEPGLAAAGATCELLAGGAFW